MCGRTHHYVVNMMIFLALTPIGPEAAQYGPEAAQYDPETEVLTQSMEVAFAHKFSDKMKTVHEIHFDKMRQATSSATNAFPMKRKFCTHVLSSIACRISGKRKSAQKHSEGRVHHVLSTNSSMILRREGFEPNNGTKDPGLSGPERRQFKPSPSSNS
jgi:hypothetical protein